ncbi:hypothetical protein PACTADRAFT_51316 [Pachysolen tannophilus NRRL Y-2460]|uniref:Inheritance of peroxisomes protein 1 n=1 Tax=Pachysolen tannophilus NRRL Y-2460 TaxID=669874 RepID=A0A1E4TRW0_PACTA|nr:hypothetical protein PACTADRAFT_51316 [Pachysolen tannophilus NRRL Y-2460]
MIKGYCDGSKISLAAPSDILTLQELELSNKRKSLKPVEFNNENMLKDNNNNNLPALDGSNYNSGNGSGKMSPRKKTLARLRSHNEVNKKEEGTKIDISKSKRSRLHDKLSLWKSDTNHENGNNGKQKLFHAKSGLSLRKSTSFTRGKQSIDEDSQKVNAPIIEHGKKNIAKTSNSNIKSNNNNNNNNNNENAAIFKVKKTPVTSSIEKNLKLQNDKQKPITSTTVLDDKISLFSFNKAKITAFENGSSLANDDMPSSFDVSFNSLDKVIGHGFFEIYQIHGGSVTYLQCGSVVYPLLPKLKILRTSLNQFILFLSNPERYWQIFICCRDTKVLKSLENSFKKVCKYRDLYVPFLNEEDELQVKELQLKEQQVKEPQERNRQFKTTSPIVRENSKKSISSITSEMACFNINYKDNLKTPNNFTSSSTPPAKINPSPQNFNFKQPTNMPIIKRVSSNTSSLDSELDELQEITNGTLNQPRSKSSSVVTSDIQSIDKQINIKKHQWNPKNPRSRPSLDFVKSTPKLSPKSSFAISVDNRNSSFDTLHSKHNSLYIAESSWMDPDDGIDVTYKEFSNDEESNSTTILKRSPNSSRTVYKNLEFIPPKRFSSAFPSESNKGPAAIKDNRRSTTDSTLFVPTQESRLTDYKRELKQLSTRGLKLDRNEVKGLLMDSNEEEQTKLYKRQSIIGKIWGW